MVNNKGVSLGHDTGWNEVVRKKKRVAPGGGGRVDVASSVWKIPYSETCSFFFSDFPNTHGAKEMLKAFKFYGDALEVVIPSKRDKWGKRFGFVRFSNVTDLRMFAVKLDNIIFGSKKIHVNIPRFQRERSNAAGSRFGPRELTEKPLHQAPNNQQPRHVKTVWRRKDDVVDGERRKDGEAMFNAWKNGNARNIIVPKIVTTAEKNTAEVRFSVGEEAMQKFSNMYVATVRTSGSTYFLHEWFNMQGFFLVKVTSLGANKVLLEEMEEGVMRELLKNYKEWLDEKFDDIRGWEPHVVDKERVVWVRCHGIPVHAWTDEFFASLAKNFGEYLSVDEATRTKSSLDVARLRLRSTGFDVFNAVVTANINGSFFTIKMVEEWCGPLQWVESNCCNKKSVVDESSDSDDDFEEDPPLFGVEDECFDHFEEDVDGGETEPEADEVGDEELEDLSFVQDSIEVREVVQNVVEVVNPKELLEGRDGVLLENGNSDVVVEPVVGEDTHVSNSRGIGGSQAEESNGVEEANSGSDVAGVNCAGGSGNEGRLDMYNEVNGGNINNAEVGAVWAVRGVLIRQAQFSASLIGLDHSWLKRKRKR